MNFSRATFVLVLAALVLLAAFYFKERAKQHDYFAEANEALHELSGQIESQQQALAALESRIHTMHGQPLTSTPTADAVLLSPELMNRVLTLLEEQSNALSTIQKQLSSIPAESPVEAKGLTQAGLAYLRQQHAEENQKLKVALEKLESLRLSLSVPDEIAALDEESVVNDLRLVAYREFFEAKQSYEESRRLVQVLQLKLAAEEIDANLPSSR